jgi:D-alanyl-D-alanine carboxypeptidase (penicillin-binding protein 5/6)
MRIWVRLTGLFAGIVLIAGLAEPALARPALTRQALTRQALAVTARSAYLVDLTTGTTVYAKGADRRVPVASLAKIMTAYVVRQEGALTDIVTISAQDVRHAVSSGATRAGLRAGERMTTRDLLYALLLPSAADAAGALARRYGPGTAAFVAKMNAAAQDLGLGDTRYVNPDGLPSPSNGGYSSARDQTRLAEIALGDPVISTVARTTRHAVAATALHGAHTWHNTNDLLASEPGALGLKTGYTRAAGYCLMFAVVRDGHTLVGAVLGDTGDKQRFRTTARLLDLADV